MTTVWVVPAFDTVEDRHAGFSLGTEYPAVNEFAFKGCEGAFGHSVAKTVAYGAHVRHDWHLSAAFVEDVPRLLAVLIAVMDDAGGTGLPQHHVERFQYRLGAQVMGTRQPTTRRLKASTTTARNRESSPGRRVGQVGHYSRPTGSSDAGGTSGSICASNSGMRSRAVVHTISKSTAS